MVTKDATILVKNLAHDVTEELLRERFGKYGKITDIVINGNMAMIEYELEENALDAIVREDKKLLQGRPIEIEIFTRNAANGMVMVPLHSDEQAWAGAREGRRQSGGAPYRDRSPAREARPENEYILHDAGAAENTVNGVEIIAVSNSERAYAERIEKKFVELKVRVGMFIVQPAIMGVTSMLEIIRNFGVPFAIVVDKNNEKQETVSLYKLHNGPKEWKDLPTKEAIAMVMVGLAPADPLTPKHPGFVYRMLYRVFDNRALQTHEYDALLCYLADERDKTAERRNDARLAKEALRSAIRSLNLPGGERRQDYTDDQLLDLVTQIASTADSDVFRAAIREIIGDRA